jgi:hypothetical protein
MPLGGLLALPSVAQKSEFYVTNAAVAAAAVLRQQIGGVECGLRTQAYSTMSLGTQGAFHTTYLRRSTAAAAAAFVSMNTSQVQRMQLLAAQAKVLRHPEGCYKHPAAAAAAAVVVDGHAPQASSGQLLAV